MRTLHRATAACSAVVDPVLGFDQAAFDAQMGADTFPLAHNYEFVFSENVTAPIPEPRTYAMMLAGLMPIGWMARRRIGWQAEPVAPTRRG
jgi:hypothetical protein